MHRLWIPLMVGAIVGQAAGCQSSVAPAPNGEQGSAIVLGTPALGHSEAVLVDVSTGGTTAGYCSGALIAPYVVLTAGHCVVGYDGWLVHAPMVGNQTASSATGLRLDYTSTASSVDFNAHDVGLVILSSPIQLPQYPVVAQSPVPDGTQVISIGRVQDGNVSTTTLYQSTPSSVLDATPDGAPFDYVGVDMIQEGDSGGPVELSASGSPPTIVAVNSGSATLQTNGTPNGSYEFLARVDLVAAWIAQQIAAYPQGAPLPPPDAGSDDAPDAGMPSSDAGTDATQDAPGCIPICENQACGGDDGCGGVCPSGSCGSGLHCVNAACVCDSTSCGGCCAAGQCVDGSEGATCGSGGVACSACPTDDACHAGTCDSSYVLLLGTGSGTSAQQTWTWDGTSWAQTAVAHAPPFDAQGPIVSLNGVATAFGSAGTWTWSGSDWQQQTPATAPPARSGYGMTLLGGTLVLFGGFDSSQQLYNDTWTWDGTTWTQAQVASPPPARYGHSMTTWNGSVILYGGMGGNSYRFNDTWSWDGSTWTQVDLAPGPVWGVIEYEPASDAPPGGTSVMATVNGQLVLVDQPLGATPGTYAWSGSAWSLLASGPGNDVPGAMAAFGSGLVLLVNSSPPQTWLWSGSTWTPAGATTPLLNWPPSMGSVP